eukprot:3677159-Lingulodinium_polyedra.AAC.1
MCSKYEIRIQEVDIVLGDVRNAPNDNRVIPGRLPAPCPTSPELRAQSWDAPIQAGRGTCPRRRCS